MSCLQTVFKARHIQSTKKPPTSTLMWKAYITVTAICLFGTHHLSTSLQSRSRIIMPIIMFAPIFILYICLYTARHMPLRLRPQKPWLPLVCCKGKNNMQATQINQYFFRQISYILSQMPHFTLFLSTNADVHHTQHTRAAHAPHTHRTCCTPQSRPMQCAANACRTRHLHPKGALSQLTEKAYKCKILHKTFGNAQIR